MDLLSWASETYYCANCKQNQRVAMAWAGAEAILRCQSCGFSCWEALLANAKTLDAETKKRTSEIAARKAAEVRAAEAEAAKLKAKGGK